MAEHRFGLSQVLALSAIAEFLTGVALLAVPGLVAMLLLGQELPPIGMIVARVAGVALMGLGVSCWPGLGRHRTRAAPYRGMLAYTVLVAGLLAYAGAVLHLAGLLLWPAVVLHVAIALALLVLPRASAFP